MEHKTLQVEQVLEDSSLYNGTTVTVEGLFCATFYEEALLPLSQKAEKVDLKLSVRIDHPGLTDKCFAALSPYIGGEYYYYDRAIITGTFLHKERPVLESIKEMKILRNGEEFKIAVG